MEEDIAKDLSHREHGKVIYSNIYIIIEKKIYKCRVWSRLWILYFRTKMKIDRELKSRKKLAKELLQLSSEDSEECMFFVFNFDIELVWK